MKDSVPFCASCRDDVLLPRSGRDYKYIEPEAALADNQKYLWHSILDMVIRWKNLKLLTYNDIHNTSQHLGIAQQMSFPCFSLSLSLAVQEARPAKNKNSERKYCMIKARTKYFFFFHIFIPSTKKVECTLHPVGEGGGVLNILSEETFAPLAGVSPPCPAGST